MSRLPAFLLISVMFGCSPETEAGPDTGVGTAVRSTHDRAKGYILAAADAIPDSSYSFRPTPSVRSVAEQLGHIADSQNQFCVMAGAQPPSGQARVEKNTTDKAGLIAALRSSFAACDPLLGEPDSALLRQVTPGSSDPSNRLSVLILNASHNFEHYGNIVTYMRMLGLVPPSSQP